MTATTTDNGLGTLLLQLDLTFHTVHRNSDGISHDESLQRPQPGGNSLNWIIGHIIASRSGLLTQLGENPLFDDETRAQYRRGSDGDVKNAVRLEDLMATFDRSQPILTTAIERLSEERIAAKAGFGSPAGPDATLAQAISAMIFHESYHCGQLGLLRRVLGKKGAI